MTSEEATGLAAAFAAMKSIAETVGGFWGLKTEHEKRKAVNDILVMANKAQSDLAVARAENAALTTEKLQLAKENADLREFAADEVKYEIKRFHLGTTVYVDKDIEASGNPSPYYCATCFNNKKRSALQPTGKTLLRESYFTCHNCSSEYLI